MCIYNCDTHAQVCFSTSIRNIAANIIFSLYNRYLPTVKSTNEGVILPEERVGVTEPDTPRGVPG